MTVKELLKLIPAGTFQDLAAETRIDHQVKKLSGELMFMLITYSMLKSEKTSLRVMEGFLRSAGALVQTSGRAARNINGRVIMYADVVTDSMRRAIMEMERRRTLQQAFNEEHGITPQSIVKRIDEVMSSVYERDYMTPPIETGLERFRTQAELDAHISTLQDAMRAAAVNLDFERAASIRDEIRRLRNPGLVTAQERRS